MKRAALAAASVLLASAASAAPLDAFRKAFGDEGISALADRGDLVVQGQGAERRLAAVHWKALEALAAAAASCRAVARAATVEPAPAADLGLGPCRELADNGGRVRALAAAEAAAGEERWALASSSASETEPAGLPNLFETAWGKEIAARRRADRLEDPAPLAKGFFEEFLAGPRPNPDAVKHFVAVAGAGAALAADAEKGALGDDLRMTIRRYLQDERRRRGLTLARARVKELAADKSVQRELARLDALCAALSPGLVGALESAVAGTPAPGGVPRLRSAGIHLREPTRLGQYELGDAAYVSGAYWVDGLPEDGAVAVDETTFVETPRGFSSVETRTVKRRNGGPYAYERAIPIVETKSFAVVALVSAASGTVVAERTEVAVAPDFELSLKRQADALQYEQACDPKSAAAAFAALADLVVDAAKVKPQYKSLLDDARKGQARAADEEKLLAQLDDAVAAARSDSSPQQCRYDAARVDAAIKLARKLPPGCDKALPELFAQRATISRRAADQAWFLKASGQARSRLRACDFPGAEKRWSEALAVLAADPAARCGAVDEEAKKAEDGLADASRGRAWSETLDKAVAAAEAATTPAERLRRSGEVLARLGALDDRSCRGDEERRARRVADKAAADEVGPSADAAVKRLPSDASLTAAVAEVKRARDRELTKAEAADAPESPAPAKGKP